MSRKPLLVPQFPLLIIGGDFTYLMSVGYESFAKTLHPTQVQNAHLFRLPYFVTNYEHCSRQIGSDTTSSADGIPDHIDSSAHVSHMVSFSKIGMIFFLHNAGRMPTRNQLKILLSLLSSVGTFSTRH